MVFHITSRQKVGFDHPEHEAGPAGATWSSGKHVPYAGQGLAYRKRIVCVVKKARAKGRRAFVRRRLGVEKHKQWGSKMNDGTNNQTQLVIKQTSLEERIEPVSYRESTSLGCGGRMNSEGVSELRQLPGAGMGEKRASRLEATLTYVSAASLRPYISDDEFYEVFSEIRLP